MRLNPDPAGTDARPTMDVRPFHVLDAVQQAEHLVHCHGFDVDYVWQPADGPDPDGDWVGVESDADVVARFVGFGPESRASWHDGDHEDNPNGGADRTLHTHQKGTAMTCWHVTTEQGRVYGVAASCRRDAMQMTQDRLTGEGSADRPATAEDVGPWGAPFGTVLAY